jgi:myosin heavy subunit
MFNLDSIRESARGLVDNAQVLADKAQERAQTLATQAQKGAQDLADQAKVVGNLDSMAADDGDGAASTSARVLPTKPKAEPSAGGVPEAEANKWKAKMRDLLDKHKKLQTMAKRLKDENAEKTRRIKELEEVSQNQESTGKSDGDAEADTSSTGGDEATAALRAQLDEKTKKLDETTGKFKQVIEKYKKIQAAAKDFKSKYTESAATVNSQQERLTQLETELAELKDNEGGATSKESTDADAALTTKVAELQSELSKQQEESTAALQAASTEAELMSTKVRDLEARLADQETQEPTSSADAEAWASKIAALESELAEKTTMEATLKSASHVHVQEVEGLRQHVAMNKMLDEMARLQMRPLDVFKVPSPPSTPPLTTLSHSLLLWMCLRHSTSIMTER